MSVSKVAIGVLEVESKAILKSLRLDEGGKYVSTASKEFAQVKGFTHELTPPHSPQMNGMAERVWRSLLVSTPNYELRHHMGD